MKEREPGAGPGGDGAAIDRDDCGQSPLVESKMECVSRPNQLQRVSGRLSAIKTIK
jgi:hypothetical protein